MRRLGWSVMSLAAGLSLFAACSYSPQLTSGELRCSPNRECPHGYYCSTTNVCCADGDLVCSGSVGHVAADFIGTWTFGSTAMVSNECDDGKNGTNSLSGSTLTITAAPTGGTALVANWSVWQSYACPTTISLSYDNTGAHLVDTSWFCQSDTTTDKGVPISDFWVVSSFDITLTSATTGTHYGFYGLDETSGGTAV
ncbi:MAG TPA: hypothetical protein VHU40_14960, partial [Polyangia bacterium]|nr:hypothetical protein [Polyangia bacterium]